MFIDVDRLLFSSFFRFRAIFVMLYYQMFHERQLHHPGSKQQYEEVWEKQDHMDQAFDPKVFFMMHGEFRWPLLMLIFNLTAPSPRDARTVIRDMDDWWYGPERFRPKGVFHDAW